MPVVSPELSIPFLVGGPPAPAGISYIASIRERAPLQLYVDMATPGGSHGRLGWDDPDPKNVPMNLSISSVMPGGFERCGFTLERDPRLAYPDLVELSTVTVQGAGGDVAWQGRLEKMPDTGGFQEQVSPEAVGWQAHLEDDNSAREIYIDRELSRWEDMSLTRKIENVASIVLFSPSTTSSSAGSAVQTGLTGAWAKDGLCEAWYNAHGISIGKVFTVWERAGGVIDATDTKYDWELSLSPVDHGTGEPVRTGNLRAAGPGQSSATPPTNVTGLTYAILSLFYNAAGGEDGILYALNWPLLAVHGQNAGPTVGNYSLTEVPGVFASDVVVNAVSRWAPKLAFTTGPEGTIQTSSFVVPQLAFLEPTTAAEILKQAIRFELQDWAVWEGPTFFMNPRGERGKEWRARVGPAQLQETGPQVSRLWNGVITIWTDFASVQRTVGPPGSGAEATSTRLIDEDPENPLNEIGIKKYAKLSMGTTTLAGAEQVGAIFLRETKGLDSSGNATLVGHVEDSAGILWPAWEVRAGDTVSFVDASDPSPRRIVHSSYEDSNKSCTIALDQPPDSLTAILERLSANLIGTGLS